MPRRPIRGFTLIELIAVIVILAILAAVALPRYFDWGDEAKFAAAKNSRGDLATAVKMWRMNEAAEHRTPTWPSDFDGVLQSPEGEEILNPYRDPAQPVYDLATGAAVAEFHPRFKTIEHALTNGWGAIWYNPNNGVVRFRVPDQGMATTTVRLYNAVNRSSVSSLLQQAE